MRAAAALALACALPAAAVTDYYTNVHDDTPLIAVFQLSFEGAVDRLVEADAWISAVSVLLGPSPPAYTVLTALANGVPFATAAIPTSSAVDAPPFGTHWISVRGGRAEAAGCAVTASCSPRWRR